MHSFCRGSQGAWGILKPQKPGWGEGPFRGEEPFLAFSFDSTLPFLFQITVVVLVLALVHFWVMTGWCLSFRGVWVRWDQGALWWIQQVCCIEALLAFPLPSAELPPGDLGLLAILGQCVPLRDGLPALRCWLCKLYPSATQLGPGSCPLLNSPCPGICGFLSFVPHSEISGVTIASNSVYLPVTREAGLHLALLKPEQL